MKRTQIKRTPECEELWNQYAEITAQLTVKSFVFTETVTNTITD